MKHRIFHIHTIIWVIFLVVLTVPAILPYFHAGYFPTHDGEWAVVRLGDMYRELKDLQLPPRYSGNLNFGYGYPLFNFAYPFPYYFGFIFHVFRFGLVDSIKLIFASSVILSALFMFLASKELWKNTLAGVISACLYIYLPYRFVDLYVRGSIGESLAFAFFPLLLWLLVKIAKAPQSRLFIIATAYTYGALITTHNIMSVLFTPVFCVLAYALFDRKAQWQAFLFSVLGGLLLSAFFWVPALMEKKYILLAKIPIADRSLYFVSLKQLFIPAWGYGVPTGINGFSYQLGWPHILVFVLTILFVVWIYISKQTKHRDINIRIPGIIVIVSLVYLFLLFPFSGIVWETVPLLKEINYPWTLLGPLGFLFSVLVGFLIREKKLVYIGIFLATMAVLSFVSYAKPEYYVDRGDQFYLTNDATTTSSQELMPLWVKTMLLARPTHKVEVIRGIGKIENINNRSNHLDFIVSASQKTNIRVNTIYYPGWNAYLNQKPIPITYNNTQGVMEVSLPPGDNHILFTFTETPIRLISDLVSVITFLGSIVVIVLRKRFYISASTI